MALVVGPRGGRGFVFARRSRHACRRRHLIQPVLDAVVFVVVVTGVVQRRRTAGTAAKHVSRVFCKHGSWRALWRALFAGLGDRLQPKFADEFFEVLLVEGAHAVLLAVYGHLHKPETAVMSLINL